MNDGAPGSDGDDPGDGRIVPIGFAKALGDRYLSYALSTITARSLPDVRDGLKPVHRRLLYAMRQLKLDPATAPKKCARVVGDVIGQYHPHGDQSVYEALVRLAQPFSVRYPLVDGQGNFGNIDGDNAAAMRYTEARLTAFAQALLDGIDEDAVDFRPTYDEEGREPLVLPASVPNLLANGAQGIAVGMATNIPPHNVGELCAALTLLIDRSDVAGAGRPEQPPANNDDPNVDPEAVPAEGEGEEPGAPPPSLPANPGLPMTADPVTVGELAALMPGPDFPTGGELVETAETITETYRTGRGSLRLRARWSVEKTGQGTYIIVVYEIPYQVPKAKLIEKIADLINGRHLPLLNDVRDESADDVRLVLEPKSRNVDPDVLMEHLYRKTDLETRFGVNLNVLDAHGVPRIMGIKEALQAFLVHRHTVLVRRSRHRLAKILDRLAVLDGYLIAFLNLDEVIRIIREEDDAKAGLIAAFALTDMQAEAILNMRLRALRKLEEIEIRREHDKLSAERAELEALLAEGALRWQRIRDELADIRTRFGSETELGRRRTVIGSAPTGTTVPIEAFIEREPITVFLSTQGWIRSVKGHQADPTEVKYKEGDSERFVLRCQTTDKVQIMASTGRFYSIAADKLPRGRGFGEPLRLSVDMPNDSEVVTVFVYDPEVKLIVAADDGRGFIVSQSETLAQTKAGRQVLSPGKGATAMVCKPVSGDMIALLGTNHKLLVFSLSEVPEMAKGRGVILQKYKEGKLLDLKTFNDAEGLKWGRRTLAGQDLLGYRGARAGAGRLRPKGFSSVNGFN
ncbi:DNA topoisomerase IV subunit A [Fodinicurvata sp. EGI_FJ10296]|uniref:DNA topoisomerase IV subunit A n=1 Tax=Fodinicurvata sp. EGI_FJ10296 TaxID=3231908 RepID=UPI0034568DBB